MSELSLRRHALTCALASLLACTATPAPYRVRFADLAHGTAVGYDGERVLVIELQPGERIPVNLQFDGEDFDVVPAHPSLELVVKHHYFVRIWQDGIRASLDGEHFDEKPRTPGRFRVGFEAHPGEAMRFDVLVVSPRRRGTELPATPEDTSGPQSSKTRRFASRGARWSYRSPSTTERSIGMSLAVLVPPRRARLSLLYSDGASKRRFVHVPPGAGSPGRRLPRFDVPVGTYFIKTFFYPYDAPSGKATRGSMWKLPRDR